MDDMANNKPQAISGPILKAFPGYITVEPYERTSTNANITISENVKDMDLVGKVIDVGEDTISEFSGVKITTPAKVGDIIVHKTYYTQPFTYKGVNYKFIKFQDVCSWFNEN